MGHTPGQRLREALNVEKPLQVAGAIHAYSAIMAERVGFRALYLSGAGVANASFGLPDLGITTLQDCLEEVRRITSVYGAAAARRCRYRLRRSLPNCAHDEANESCRSCRRSYRGSDHGQKMRTPSQ